MDGAGLQVYWSSLVFTGLPWSALVCPGLTLSTSQSPQSYLLDPLPPSLALVLAPLTDDKRPLRCRNY